MGIILPYEPDPELGDILGHFNMDRRSVVLPVLQVELGMETVTLPFIPRFMGEIWGSLPGVKLYLPFKINVSDKIQVYDGVESIITGQLDRLTNEIEQSNLDIDGIIIDANLENDARGLLAYAAISFAVKIKGINKNLEIITMVSGNPFKVSRETLSRMANYSDAMGLETDSNLLTKGVNLRKLGLKKPIYLKFNPRSDGNLLVQYLDLLSKVTDPSISIDINTIWVNDIPSTQVEQLFVVAASLDSYIWATLQSIRNQDSPFKVSAATGEKVKQRVFVNVQGSQIVILVDNHSGEMSSQVKEFIVHGKASGKVSTSWFDIPRSKPIEIIHTQRQGKSFTQRAFCEPGFFLVSIQRFEEEEQFSASMKVSADVGLLAEEIVARWQQYNESQKKLLRNYSAECIMDLHFEPTNIGSGFDITTYFNYFWNNKGVTEWEQTRFFLNGIEYNNERGFPLPQLEPEKILTKPLDLKLVQKYQYEYHGTDEVDGVLCHVIGFTPKEENENLYSGKIWIDAFTFRRVRMLLSQKGMGGNISSHHELQKYELVDDGYGNKVNLLKSIKADQQLNAAGRNFLLEKKYEFKEFTINTSTFKEDLAEARKSKNPMFKDTDVGLRELRLKDGERVLNLERATRIKAIITGLLYEGTFDFPIPLLGVSFVDFDFLDRDLQLSVFWAGPIFAGNLSKLWPNGFRIGMDLAFSGVGGFNRYYEQDLEIEDKTFHIWDEALGFRVSWQATSSINVTGKTYFSYNYYKADDDLEENYRTPRNGVTISPGLEIQYSNKGYNIITGASWSRRLDWQGFGYEPESSGNFHDSFTNYFGRLSKTFFITSFTKTGLELSYFGGENLDRFSRYQPAFFSQPSIRGIPSGTDTFDNIGIATASIGFNVMDFIRLEGFYNHAWAQNKSESSSYVDFDGLEISFGTIGPWETYLKGTVSYALKGNIDRYNSRWSAYLLVFFPFKAN